MLNVFYKWLMTKEALDQEKSEAIIALLTLLYHADDKIRMEEQELFDKFLDSLPWHKASVSKESYHRDMVAKSRTALQQQDLSDYLSSLVIALKGDSQVLTMLRELAVSDGDVHPKEAEILSLVVKQLV
jgi:uncharacterized tellurite resistance protein B-like protein